MNSEIERVLRSGNLRATVDALEEAEAMARDDELMSWPYKLILLLHIALDEVEMAELVWKRMPEAMTMDVEAQKCHRLLHCVLRGDIAGSWQHLPDGLPEDGPMSVAVAAIREKLAADAIKTLEKVYAAIELKRVCEMCHANEEDVVRRIQSKGWAVDNGMVIVSQGPKSAAVGAAIDLSSLAKLVVHLES